LIICHSLQFSIEFDLLDDEAQNECDSSMSFSLSPPGSPSDNLAVRFQSYERVGMIKHMLKIEQAIQKLHKKEEDQNRERSSMLLRLGNCESQDQCTAFVDDWINQLEQDREESNRELADLSCPLKAFDSDEEELKTMFLASTQDDPNRELGALDKSIDDAIMGDEGAHNKRKLSPIPAEGCEDGAVLIDDLSDEDDDL